MIQQLITRLQPYLGGTHPYAHTLAACFRAKGVAALIDKRRASRRAVGVKETKSTAMSEQRQHSKEAADEQEEEQQDSEEEVAEESEENEDESGRTRIRRLTRMRTSPTMRRLPWTTAMALCSPEYVWPLMEQQFGLLPDACGSLMDGRGEQWHTRRLDTQVRMTDPSEQSSEQVVARANGSHIN